MFKFNEALFSELRVIPVSCKVSLTDEDLVRAITDNENLVTIGFTLKPQDIVRLAKSDISIYETVKGYVEKVDAEPMYPDFPTQVMEMDEATFRFHQLVHYFSTYGMESLFGVEVKKGWLPDVSSTKKTVTQDAVLPSKTITLIDNNEKYEYVLKKLLTKRERLSVPEKELVAEAARKVDPAIIADIPVAFKENLMDLFFLFFEKKNDDAIFSVCQHTGDVLTCLRYLLTRHHYKLSTSERKRCVRLIERYPVDDFRTNLILSNKKARNSFIVLDYLSYNKYSRSIEHKLVVKDFRDGKLHSWESNLKKLLSNKDEKALPFIAKRPGMLVRMVAWLLRLGYPEADIMSALIENAENLSIQTLVTILNQFGSKAFAEKEEREGVYRVILTVLAERLKYLVTPLKDKKVFVDEGIYDFSHSRIETNDKSEEGGYIRSGLTFKIPETVKVLRFFVYWNDKRRVDIDLHSQAVDSEGNFIHIGWNGDFKDNGICFSGDITYSDAAEFIDIDMENNNVALCSNNIHIYSGRPNFGEIETCFTGMMAVTKTNQDAVLYDPKNCFFYHNLSGKSNRLSYCLIDPQNRLMQIIGKETDSNRPDLVSIEAGLSVNQYLKLLFAAQGATVVEDKSEADLTVQLDKGGDICLIDENFFMDA